MKEKRITLSLTETNACELKDLLNRINDQYEHLESYEPKNASYVKTYQPILIFHSEATALNKLLVQLDAKS